MGDRVEVSVDVAAPPEVVYDLVSDVPRMGEWSPECERCDWLDGATGAATGARFRGHNRNGIARWSTTCTVEAAERGREFRFGVTSLFGLRVAGWGYVFEPTEAGCTVTEVWDDRRGKLLKSTAWTITGVMERVERNRRGMQKTLAELKTAAESISN